MPVIEGHQRPTVKYRIETTLRFFRHNAERDATHLMDATRGLLGRKLSAYCGARYIDVTCKKAVSSGSRTKVVVEAEIQTIDFSEEDSEEFIEGIRTAISDTGNVMKTLDIQETTIEKTELTPNGWETFVSPQQDNESTESNDDESSENLWIETMKIENAVTEEDN